MKTRVATALILIPVILVILMSASPWPLFALAALVAGASCQELARLGGRREWTVPIVPVLVLLGYTIYGLVAPGWIPIAQLTALTLFGSIVAPLWIQRKTRLLLEVASLWCVCPLLIVAILHATFASPGWLEPKTPVLLLVIPLWVGDSLAYFVGKSIGRHLLAAKLSPKKTVEGAIANVAGCILAALVTGWAISIPLSIALGAGALAATLGQSGDLFESALKRSAGIKDAGNLLPGHGGVLDRIDSLLLSAPFQALLLATLLPITSSR